MSQPGNSSDQDISEFIRPTAGGPDEDVAALMHHLQTRVRTEYCKATVAQPSNNFIWSELKAPAQSAPQPPSPVEHLIGCAAAIDSKLLEDRTPPQPRLAKFIQRSGIRRLKRFWKAVALMAYRQVQPLIQAQWQQQSGINQLVLAQNRELLRKLNELEAALGRQNETLRQHEERMAWLVGEVLKTRTKGVPLRVYSSEAVSRAA